MRERKIEKEKGKKRKKAIIVINHIRKYLDTCFKIIFLPGLSETIACLQPKIEVRVNQDERKEEHKSNLNTWGDKNKGFTICKN